MELYTLKCSKRRVPTSEKNKLAFGVRGRSAVCIKIRFERARTLKRPSLYTYLLCGTTAVRYHSCANRRDLPVGLDVIQSVLLHPPRITAHRERQHRRVMPNRVEVRERGDVNRAIGRLCGHEGDRSWDDWSAHSPVAPSSREERHKNVKRCIADTIRLRVWAGPFMIPQQHHRRVRVAGLVVVQHFEKQQQQQSSSRTSSHLH